ncbi:MAG: DUF2877 domain-containing protein [Deltaproteobacteria bacterium]|nr:DUF2877 domain-containing protein [Deltaproteobacteria bacterium]
MTLADAGRRFDRALVERDLPWSGRVSAVYRRAAVLEPDAPGEPRITLLAEERPLVPGGIALPWGELAPRAGEPARLDGRTLRLGDGATGAQRTVRLEGDGVSLRLTPPLGPEEIEGPTVRWAPLPLPQRTRALLGLDPVHEDGVEATALRRAAGGLRALTDALCLDADDPASWDRLVRALAGLGPGSTPTGDDLLVGLAAAGSVFAGAERVSRAAYDRFVEALRGLPADVTSPVGREMLANAARGSFPEPLLALVECWREPRRGAPDIAAAMTALADVGAHSGADMLAGALAVVLHAPWATTGAATGPA